jgi:hypothetical protein
VTRATARDLEGLSVSAAGVDLDAMPPVSVTVISPEAALAAAGRVAEYARYLGEQREFTRMLGLDVPKPPALTRLPRPAVKPDMYRRTRRRAR